MLESELVEGREYEGSDLISFWRGRYKKTLARPYADSQGRRWIHLGSGFVVLIDTLRPVTPVTPAPIADGDRLFEGACCWFCGGDRFAERSFGKHMGLRYCRACVESLGGVWFKTSSVEVADAEYERRLALAASAQKLVSGSVGSMEVATREDANLMSWKYDRGLMSSIQRAEPERPTADDLAWAIRRETLAAEERKRWHLEERRKAYRAQRGDQLGLSESPTPDQIAAFGRQMDAAIARVKPAERDEPAYVNLNWPEADPNDP